MRRSFLAFAVPTGAELAKLIQELRYRTDAPILQCKNALRENDGDMEKAIAWLRAKGAADSVKKEGRETAFGTLALCLPNRSPAITVTSPGAILEMAAETDFAVRNEKFVALTGAIASDIAEMFKDTGVQALPEAELFQAVVARNTDKVKTTIAALGENLVLKRVLKVAIPEHGSSMPRYAPEGCTGPAALTLGAYVHNATPLCPTVGSIIGVSAVWSYKADTVLSQADADDFAQHLVSHLGDTGDVAHQAFLGSAETVSQWSKARTCRLSVGVLHKYGLETPQLVVPRPMEAPNKGHPKDQQQQRQH